MRNNRVATLLNSDYGAMKKTETGLLLSQS